MGRGKFFLLAGAVPLAMAGTATGSAAATPGRAAAACTHWVGVKSPSLGTTGATLNGVTAVSAKTAWAVGFTADNFSPAAWILRWNGSSWRQAPNPESNARGSILWGVSASSASDAWAVGWLVNQAGRHQTLILHWNGSSWRQVPSPNPTGSTHNNALLGVDAVSPTNAWAVGEYFKGSDFRTLVLHWNGSSWRQITDKNANPAGQLDTVAVAGGDLWTGGARDFLLKSVLVTHTASGWQHTSAPAGFEGVFNGIAATSASDVWGVAGGATGDGQSTATVILHWDGSSWQQVASPSPGSNGGTFTGVAATSAGNAWAVGYRFNNAVQQRTFVVQWNGSAWQKVATPDGGARDAVLSAVAAVSPQRAWAVGTSQTDPLAPTRALILRCQ
jgi:hypothetical protein